MELEALSIKTKTVLQQRLFYTYTYIYNCTYFFKYTFCTKLTINIFIRTKICFIDNTATEISPNSNNQSSLDTNQSTPEIIEAYNDKDEINQAYNYKAYCLKLRCHRFHQTCCKPIFYLGETPKLYCCDPETYHMFVFCLFILN